jgi:transposase, IS5 family
VEVILRMLLCKHLYGWSYEETRERVADSLVLRWFCRVYLQAVPDKSTLIRWTHTLRPQTLQTRERPDGRTGQAGQGDRRAQAEAGCDLRANDQSSSDRQRAAPGQRARALPVGEARQAAGGRAAPHRRAACRSRLRSARRAAQALHRLPRRKSETKEQEQRALDQKLIETAEQMGRQTERVVHPLDQQRESVAKRLREEAKRVVPLVKRVIAQTRSRVLEG